MKCFYLMALLILYFRLNKLIQNVRIQDNFSTFVYFMQNVRTQGHFTITQGPFLCTYCKM